MNTCQHIDAPRCPRIGCLAPHGVCISEGIASAQRINAHYDDEDEDEADNDVRSGMRMLAFAIVFSVGMVAVIVVGAVWKWLL